jgi:hypothetical protein
MYVGPLDFKSSAMLFGNTSVFVSSTGSPVAHTAEEFSAFLVPPSVAKLADQSKNSSQRQKELYERLGSGIPANIIETATNLSESEFTEILRTAQRPEVQVDSGGALEIEARKRTAHRDKAVKGKNYLRAKDLTFILEELEGLKSMYPSLTELIAKERATKRELATALGHRKYEEANTIKRKMLNLKKTILKEKNSQPAEAVCKYTASGKFAELQAQMDKMLQIAERMSMDQSLSGLDASTLAGLHASNILTDYDDDAETATFVVNRDDHTCFLHIYCGDIFTLTDRTGISGIVCWTNENCDLTCNDRGKELLQLGGRNLLEDISSLPTLTDTTWGPVKCGTGEATMLGPRTYSKLGSRFVILSVSPLSTTNDDDDWDGDENQDEDALHYLDTAMRSSYRSSFQMINVAGMETVAIPTITSKETGGTYERTLRVGLQTLVEETKFTNLKHLHLVTSSKKEATKLIKMALEMGLACAVVPE